MLQGSLDMAMGSEHEQVCTVLWLEIAYSCFLDGNRRNLLATIASWPSQQT